jgi:hypothetical protein
MKPFKGSPSGVLCESCPYSQKDLAVDPRGPYECHLNPPLGGTRPSSSECVPSGRWPLVAAGDWCGHHPAMLNCLDIRKKVRYG